MAKMADAGLLFGVLWWLITKKVGIVSGLTVGTRKISAAFILPPDYPSTDQTGRKLLCILFGAGL